MNIKPLIKQLPEQDFDYYDEGATHVLDHVLFTLEERHGGCEGGGSDFHLILKAEYEGETEYWKVPGYYSSDEGGELEWESAFRVEPFEKTTTAYKKFGTDTEV